MESVATSRSAETDTGRISWLSGQLFFRVLTYGRQRFLADEAPLRWPREVIDTTRADYPFDIDARALLPDHPHRIGTLPEGARITRRTELWSRRQ